MVSYVAVISNNNVGRKMCCTSTSDVKGITFCKDLTESTVGLDVVLPFCYILLLEISQRVLLAWMWCSPSVTSHKGNTCLPDVNSTV
jgi:hypothetical protein